MAYEDGRQYKCDICGKTVFCKHLGDEEMDGGFTRHSKFDHLPKGWHEGCGIGSTMGEIWCDTCFARIVAAEERERKQILGVDVVFLKEDSKE